MQGIKREKRCMHRQTRDNARPGKIILTEEELVNTVTKLGLDISRDYKGKNPILVNLLKGGVVFLADLIRKLSIPHQIDFLGVSSYDNGTSSSGVVRIIEDLSSNIEGRHVLIIEDIIDTGTTLAYIHNMLKLRHPKSLEVCTLLKKKTSASHEVPIRYIGALIPNVFVVGYGLDYREKFRYLPYVARLVRGD
jgi:hypoxanthine phosphoribosyltransferase